MGSKKEDGMGLDGKSMRVAFLRTEGGYVYFMINGVQYVGYVFNDTIAKRFRWILKYSSGKALNYLKRRCEIRKVE